MDDIFIRYQKLPLTIPALTVLDDNGDYNVYINPALSFSRQLRARRHEMMHIRGGHFYDDCTPLEELEAEANAGENDSHSKR